uniref:RHS repeat-associated core domain-containing protein n=1 Tax=Enterobacter quasiroggenkampii TaxID=2497436 RepID=UPI001F2AFF96
LLRESETQVSGYSQNLRMQGQYLGREKGLHYNLFRYYDPDCGRFTQQDPIGLAGGINLYQYAPNALTWVDPLGLASTNNPGVYDVYGESYLPKDMFRMSDGKHFQEANRQLYYKMNNDPLYKAALEEKFPGIFEKVSPGKRGAFPRTAPTGSGWETTWHHHERVGGLLQLVDGPDHNSRHLDYHPKEYGGRKTWGGGSRCR